MDTSEEKLEEVAATQVKTGEDIQRILTNYKKDSEDRKTKEYLVSRLTKLETLWEQFCKTNAAIEEFSVQHADHAYFRKNYYGQIVDLYKTTKELMQNKLKSLEGSETKEHQQPRSIPQVVTTLSQTIADAVLEQSPQLRRQLAAVQMMNDLIAKIKYDQPSKVYYQRKMQDLTQFWGTITTNQMELIGNPDINQDCNYFKQNVYSSLEELYEQTMILLQTTLEDKTTSSVRATEQNQVQPQKVKLPPLQVPQFNGDYQHWKSFQDLFVQLIHSNPSLGKAQKMYYLKSNLGGEARKILQHFKITDENYETAWELLNSRYNNQRLLVTTEIHKLLTQPTCTSESAHNLKRLHDTSKECLSAIRNLNIKTEDWGPLVTHILVQKLDKETHKHYEERLNNPREVQSLENFFKFLEYRFQALEAIGDKGRKENTAQKPLKSSLNSLHTSNKAKVPNMCPSCKGNHAIYFCKTFLNMNVAQRRTIVKNHKLCTNCLQSSHEESNCKSLKTCRICSKRHNTLLHIDSKSTQIDSSAAAGRTTSSSASIPQVNANMANASSEHSQVILPTAVLNAIAHDGSSIKLRALVDQGSQATLITENAVQLLQLKKVKVTVTVNGLGDNKAETARAYVKFTITPRFESNFKLPIKALVLSKLTRTIPAEPIQLSKWPHVHNLVLADPQFFQPGRIDIILGADVLSEILTAGVIKGPFGTPLAQQTALGWILSGKIKSKMETNKTTCFITSIEDQLRKFWELEELPKETSLDSDDQKCQRFYEKTVKRTTEGNYIVRLPFNEKLDNYPLGESRNKAVARLIGMEAKFKKTPQLEQEYKLFMKEYERLGHLKLRQNINEEGKYYMPHHAVIKEDSSTTKLRVVFDASARSSSGLSLNDKLLTGPTLQQDLFSILLRWRKHRVAYKADIEKMYRQIQVAEDDQQFQIILWRNTPQESIKEYQLTTVTYGTRAAPYLAVRTLLQLAIDEKNNYPIASEITKKDFYVDDLISGGDSVREAKRAQRQLINMMSSGGFKLRKWASHSPELLSDLPQDSVEIKPFNISDRDQTSLKALGIQWVPKTDTFRFSINFSNSTMLPTKRSMLSEASRIFDPLGWLTPATVVTKIMLQNLWLEGLKWDDPLPPRMAKEWIQYKKNLSAFNELKISRWIHHSNDTEIREIHGFCDASEKAYAAVAYFRTFDSTGRIRINLLAAKSKVAPLKKSISIPRLELCAAVLLARLLKKIKEAMEIGEFKTYIWTDSSVVLAWIKGDASKWKSFVASRVAIIQAITDPNRWHYVKSEENPADVASRGCKPNQLLTHSLWWTGPHWLKERAFLLPHAPTEFTNLEARKIKAVQVTTTEETGSWNLYSRYSSIATLTKVVAYCRRFIQNTRALTQNQLKQKHLKAASKVDPATVEETWSARIILIKAVQKESFAKDFDRLHKGKQLKSNSEILTLNPFLDSNQILRVGGRLQNAEIDADQKHPIILPYKHPLTSLIIQEAHLTTLHGGVQLTLAHLRLRYWIIKGQSAVKQHLHKCVICCRQNARTGDQIMGNLPASRTAMVRPFTNTGVDYAGPLNIRMSKGRGSKSLKGYIVIFICLSTKAIHLEAATDLSAEAFMAAFRRLVGRRGLVKDIYSDNATNFTLANKILELNTNAFKTQYQDKIIAECINLGTTWHFIPPSAPNFGGLWEAGVKSVKHHLKRILKETKLTFEELSTVLVQVEACLNSRPLCPISSDPKELDVLTPGHFLIGSSLLAPPAGDISNQNSTLQNRWQLVQRLQQDFWKKWSREYLSRLQERPKWLRRSANIEVGQIVTIKDENLPPTRWALARVIETHPGQDGIVRVATLKTKNSIIKRPISKLCLLPVKYSATSSPTTSTSSSQEKEDILTAFTRSKEANASTSSQETNPTQGNLSKISETVDYDELLRKAYNSARPTHKKVKIAPATIYNNLVTKERQEEAFNKFKIRYPKTAHEMEKRRRKEHDREVPRKRALTTHSELSPSPTLRHTTFSNNIILLVLALLIVPLLARQSEPIKISPFKENPGIYFEEVGRLSVINSQWNIISYYDITNYVAEIQGIREIVSSLGNLCNQTIIRKNSCVQTLYQLQHELQVIENNHQLLNQLNEGPRAKRSPLNFVGTVANKLFGILDAEFAEEINKEIEKTRQNENHLLKLAKNQTSIIEATINIVKKQDSSIKNQFKAVNDHMESLTRIVEKSGRAMHEEQTAHLISSLTAQTMLILHGCQRIQDMILDVLTDTRHGKVNPLILTPTQLRKQTALIKEHLPGTLTLPGNGKRQTLLLYSLMTIKGRVLSSKILFQIHLPLLLNKHFQLFHLIPVPTPHNDMFIFIEPSTEYLAVGEHREYYFPMKQRDVDKCHSIEGEKYLCEQNHPIFNQESSISQCEMNLLNHKKELSSNCNTRATTPSNFWIQLHAANSWLYTLSHEYTFSIICGSTVLPQTLSRSGIVKLRSDCLIRQPSLIIHGHQLYESHFNSSFLPKTNLSQQLMIIEDDRRRKDISSPAFPTNSTEKDIQSLLKELDILRDNEVLPRQLSTHDVHQFSLIYFILAILFTLGIMYIFKTYSKNCKTKKAENKTKPIPAVRKKLSDDDFIVVTTTS